MTDAVLEIETDVLVVGGGPAGAWAALRGRGAGADVVLVDKGYCGTSGATAAAGTGVWYVQPDPAAREAAMASREALGGYLADRRWMARVLDETYAGMNELADRGRYPFPVDDDGQPDPQRGLQGPEYMRRMRVLRSAAPASGSSTTPRSSSCSSTPTARSPGRPGSAGRPASDYRVRAGAVVLATGGCAFRPAARSAPTSTPATGRCARPRWARSCPAWSSPTPTPSRPRAPRSPRPPSTARHLLPRRRQRARGRRQPRRPLGHRPDAAAPSRCSARLDQAEPEPSGRAMRRGQPNFFLAFDRLGHRPLHRPVPDHAARRGHRARHRRHPDRRDDCATDVPGLYAAGDAATRELICGGFTGGGSHNAAWAISSGSWAGAGGGPVRASLGAPAGRRPGPGRRRRAAADRPASSSAHREVVARGAGRGAPYDKNYLRHGDGLAPRWARCDDLWTRGCARASADGEVACRAREAAAMTAHARWMYTAALARDREPRDAQARRPPGQDPAQQHRLIVGGLDEIWTPAPRPELAVAA